MSQLLLSELTVLSSEAKRKNPDVKAVSDAALSALRSHPELALAPKIHDPAAPSAEDNILLKPILLACRGKSAYPKIVSISISLLQRVIGLRLMRMDDCPTIIDLLSHIINSRGDVEVQLKVLQVIASLLSTYQAVHHVLLAKTLHLCFQLQESRVSVVSSTAAATLRQAVMTVFEKVKEEDNVLDAVKSGGEDAAAACPLAVMSVQLSGSTSVTLFPCSRDAYLVISDLNALANNEHAPFLGLASLPRTFTLELIESILTNHALLFSNDTHPELLLCLRQSTCPLLIKAFNEFAPFPTFLRLMRLLFGLLRQFSHELAVEVEILMSILLRFVAMEPKRSSSSSRSSSDSAQTWQRVLAMEATRSLCSDGVLIRNLWTWFDSKQNSAKVFNRLVDTLHHISTENRAIIGEADALHQVGQSAREENARPSRERSYSGIYGAAAGVASAAIGGFSTSAETSVGLSHTSVPSIQLIDQLDKTDAPPVPTTYIYLLSLQALVHLGQSLAAYVLPAYSRFVNSRPESASRAPPALDFSFFRQEERSSLEHVREMIQQAWAPLLDSYSFFMTCKCDDTLFAEALTALRNFTNATGVLGLEAPRDALIASLTRFAIPRSILTRLLSARRGAEEADANLSERNAACLKAVTQIAYYLSGSLNTHWRDILEALCDAEFILRRGSTRRLSKSTEDDQPIEVPVSYEPKPRLSSISALSTVPADFYSTGSVDPSTGRPNALSNIDKETLLSDILRVFENSTALSDDALLAFIRSLCELDADAVGAAKASMRKSYPLLSLTTVIHLNVDRLAHAETLSDAWSSATLHILHLAQDPSLKQNLRMQAAEALDHFLQEAMKARDGEFSLLQQRVIDCLTQQSILDSRATLATDIEVRKIALDTIFSILEVYGHNLVLGWNAFFSTFNDACSVDASEETKSKLPLIKVSFAALQVICSDLLSKLNLDELSRCIETLVNFCKQDEDVNIALTANGSLWAITAEINSRSEHGPTQDLSVLWVRVLSSIRSLAEDERPQVRNGAVSLFFNILEQYGSGLSSTVWSEEIMLGTLLPMLLSLQQKSHAHTDENAEQDATAQLMGTEPSVTKQWQDTQILALNSTGKIVQQVLASKLLDYQQVLLQLLESLVVAFLQGPSPVSQASIKAFHNVLQAPAMEERDSTEKFCGLAWQKWCQIGASLHQTTTLFSQTNLLAYVEVFTPLHRILGGNLSPRRQEEMLDSLKGAIKYDNSNERIPDKDQLSPLQAAVTNRILELDATPAIQSRILADLAEYSTLAFAEQKQASFLALNLVSTNALVRLYRAWADETEIYRGDVVQHMFKAVSIPLKLRYQGSTSKNPPLWKNSLSAMCRLIESWCERTDQLSVDQEMVASVWQAMIEAVSGTLQPDYSASQAMPLELHDQEEHFDIILLSAIELHIWPHLGKHYVPTDCIRKLARSLGRTSILIPSKDFKVDLEEQEAADPSEKVPGQSGIMKTSATRELFAYWCLELLVMLCHAPKQRDALEKRRVAVYCLPVLVQRLTSTIAAYIAEARLHGNGALSRICHEEINFVLSKLDSLELWPGSLQAVLVPLPQKEAAMDAFLHQCTETVPSSDFRHSSKALIYHLHPLLCDFLFEVVPQAGRPATMNKAACGTSQLSEPVVVPEGFSLGSIGCPPRVSFPSLVDSRSLVRALLHRISSDWM